MVWKSWLCDEVSKNLHSFYINLSQNKYVSHVNIDYKFYI